MDVSINMILVEYLNNNNMNKILYAIFCVVIYKIGLFCWTPVKRLF